MDVETVSCRKFCLCSWISLISHTLEQTNADIPYADYFYVSTHYCIVKVCDFTCSQRAIPYFKVGEGESLLTVLCDIKYKKTPWGLVKSFIEKNCWAGIEVLCDGLLCHS